MDWPAIAAASERELDIVGVGEISLDRVLALPQFPAAGEKLAVLAEHDRPGGQVATAILGCARLALRTAFVGAVGDDESAEQALQPLRSGGVDLRAVQRIASVATRRAVVLVEGADGERCVLERRDPRTRLDVDAIDPGLVSRSRAVLVDTTDLAASVWAARQARDTGAVVILDADDPTQPLDALLPWVDFALVNRSVADESGSQSSVESRLAALCQAGPAVAVVTLGEQGAVALHGERVVASPAFAVAACDTTGAGDAFRAGWIAALLEGAGLERALRLANATAAINCTAPGAQGALPTRSELTAFLAAHPG